MKTKMLAALLGVTLLMAGAFVRAEQIRKPPGGTGTGLPGGPGSGGSGVGGSGGVGGGTGTPPNLKPTFPGPGTGGGSGSSGDGTRWMPVTVPPDCFGQRIVCKVLDAAEYAEWINTIANGTDPIGKASDWMEDTMGRRPVLVRLPSLTISRAEAVREIFRFELEVMAAVVTKLRSDVRQLQPFPSDSESVRQQKWQVVQEEGDRITRVKDQARRDSDAEQRTWHSSGATTAQPKLGEPFQQLVHSASTGTGIPKTW